MVFATVSGQSAATFRFLRLLCAMQQTVPDTLARGLVGPADQGLQFRVQQALEVMQSEEQP
jgi:hypothetical protein